MAACLAAFSILSQSGLAQRACDISIPATVEVEGAEFTLASLLAPGACPALERLAAGVRLGGVPLAGSARVLLGDDIRSQFEKVAENAGDRVAIRVPPRVVVRSAGRRASCGDIGAHLLAALNVSAPGTGGSQSIDCGAAGRIPQNAALESTRTAWNPALRSWEISARCVRAGDCVPFLVRVPGSGSLVKPSGVAGLPGIPPRSVPAAVDRARQKLLVRPGERVTLIWEQDGIRLVVPAVALDGGEPGAGVRARIEPGGRVVRAIVVSAGMLRAAA
jgi:Chaperone for flagella basal body P-ring formation